MSAYLIKSGLFGLILLIISCSAYAFPQEELTEAPPTDEAQTETVAFDDEYGGEEDEELALQDSMDRYVDIPHVKGDLNCQCGMPLERAAGGEEAEINQYPWTALLYAVESETLRIPYCGGALINNRYVLTASHCVDGMNPKMVEVVLREQNLSTITPEDDEMMLGRASLRAIRIEVDKFIQHPNYSRLTLNNDIALIRLKIRVPLNDFPLAPICVPIQEARFSQGMYATVAGYGAISETEKRTTNLQMATVRVLSNELCNSMQYHKGKVSGNMLCADGNGKGCKGDTGGPLMIRTATGRQILAGIASWSTTCNDHTRPAVYTRVSNYEPWIRENTKDALLCEN